jgi:integrase
MPYDPSRTIGGHARFGGLRPRKGQLDIRETDRGKVFAARIRFNGERIRVRFGGEWQGWTEARAIGELDYIVKQIERGEWIPPVDEQPARSQRRDVTTFQVFASMFLAKQGRIEGGRESSTFRQLKYRLEIAVDHIGHMALDAISESVVDDMVLALLEERRRIDDARAAGNPMYETYLDSRTGKQHRRQARGLSRGSINKVVNAVERVLRDAKRRRLIEFVPVDRDSRVKPESPQRSFLEIEQAIGLIAAARSLEAQHRGLTWADVDAIRTSSKSALALSREYSVSDTLIRKIRRNEVWVDRAERRRNDIPRTPIVAMLVLAGLRVSELCALDRRHVDFPGRRLHVPRIKTDASERVVPLVPALYDIVLDYCAEAELAPDSPLFLTRHGNRQTPQNIREHIIKPTRARANESLAQPIEHLTPHSLRRTFASLLAELGVAPRRAMYLLGHTDAKFTMRVYQHVLDVGSDTARQLTQLLGARPEDAAIQLSGRAHWASYGPDGPKSVSAETSWESSESEKPNPGAGFAQAADGTRTHDLLHGKQWLIRGFPLSMRIRGVGDSRGLPAISVDSGNELVMAQVALLVLVRSGSPVDLGRRLRSASEEQRSTPGLRELLGDGEVCGDERAAVGWALDPQLAVEDGKPVRQPEQTGPVGPGASDTVVAHLDPQAAVLDARRDGGASGASVLGDVGERLGDDEVRGRLDGRGEPPHRHPVLDRHRHPRSQRAHSCAQPALGQDRWQDAVRQLAQLVGRVLGVVECLGHERRGSILLVLERAVRQFERDDRVHEPLLRTVVQIANHPPALLIGRRHDPRPGRRHLVPRFGVRDRRRDELGEVPQARLGIHRERLGVRRVDGEGTP